jgi:DinB superfamily
MWASLAKFSEQGHAFECSLCVTPLKTSEAKMNSREAINGSIEMAHMVYGSYLQDLTDEQMMKRPHPECNHINWQVGHLISSENMMIGACLPGSMPALPAEFDAMYNRENALSNEPSKFMKKADLMALHDQQRAATLAALAKLSDSDLDKPSPEKIASYAPTMGSAFLMQGAHWLMHAGQWAVVRRQLNKKPLF